jgi:hypothetical protein
MKVLVTMYKTTWPYNTEDYNQQGYEMALAVEAAGTSETSVNFYLFTRRNNPQKTAIFILVAVRT